MIHLECVPIYVINLERCVERKKRMIRRLRYHQLFDQTTFISAIDSRVQINQSVSPEIACLLSHLRAIQSFLESSSDYGMILEDDVMFHNDFRMLFHNHMENLPKIIPSVIMLCTFLKSSELVEPVNDLYAKICLHSYGAQGYLVSRDYSQHCMREFSSATVIRRDNLEIITSETLLIESRGLRTLKNLLIEEAIDTTIQLPQSVEWHYEYFSRFGYSNYMAAEEDLKSSVNLILGT